MGHPTMQENDTAKLTPTKKAGRYCNTCQLKGETFFFSLKRKILIEFIKQRYEKYSLHGFLCT